MSCYLFLLLSICLKHNILKQTKTNCVQEQKKNYVCSMLILLLLHFFFDEFLEMFAFHEKKARQKKVCSFYSWTEFIWGTKNHVINVMIYISVKSSYVLWEQSQDRDPVQWCENNNNLRNILNTFFCSFFHSFHSLQMTNDA